MKLFPNILKTISFLCGFVVVLSEKSYHLVCQQLKAKDQNCIKPLYDNYGEALYGIIIRIVDKDEDAAEVLQDTFVKIWDKGETFDPGAGRLFTWMARIARNNAINKRNSKAYQKSSKIQSDEKLVYLSDKVNYVKRSDALDIKGVLTKIDDKYSHVIQLIYFGGFTQQEVSERLEIPLGTVKSRVKIGLRELRKFYDFGLTKSIIATIATTGLIS